MKTAKQVPVPISWSIRGDAKIPSLTMLINPSNLDITYSPLITETRTLGGFAHEYWGESLTTLSASGKTAMFVDSEEGLTTQKSRQTEAYQYFMSLLNIYKNNGKGYFSGINLNAAARANPSKIASLGIVIMIYDGNQYDGYFESFTYTEDASMPFNLEYSFSFKAMKILGQLSVTKNAYV
ncbi:MAG: hypothetical protein PHF86_04095 [Candidatus Nanoarchaeia archaeon]|jgi:hypothetical protein|nr:hypothetical protein [Candidatus Nanoarchaeia archaeon]